MLKLATEVWDGKECRIEWSYKTCIEYFFCGGMERFLTREEKIRELESLSPPSRKKKIQELESLKKKKITGFSNTAVLIKKNYLNMNEKLRLLDIGSCYNPFSKFSEFSCIAIDLTPATEDVLQCDFLDLKVQKNTDKENTSEVNFSEESFDIIVMSLVLEYLPASEQRAVFCFKAWQLLKQYGLCIIITPDSKSVHHNAPMIKSWKAAFEKIGFKRVKYDKLTHLQCMAFAKVSRFSEKDITTCKSLADLLYIRQDFKSFAEDVSSTDDRSEEENHNICEQFLELPNESLF
ncbi:s-adenosylmethionine sensor upstream of mTORC1 [Nephila pilipes]|uniref:S-adenosylmethionine sensor upstream of mTORC1 n=1 Tax=Nephila pilipes TaxID=299642 RepID=A0A8X6N8Z1_NEPPI|nr:s-adenosylmethionine sensor upstream of mTORC1 [Nephila pilipes]